MKNFAIAFLIAGVLLALAQCELFSKTVEYNVSGSSTQISVRYQGKNGELVEVSAASPWSTRFDLLTSKRPFLAFIHVTNYGSGDVSVNILEDGVTVAGPGTATASGGSVDLYHIIE